MKKVWIFVIVILILFLLIFIRKPNQVCFNENCFNVDIVSTIEEKQKGLMFVEKLDENKGMLFLYKNEDEKYFWMKNMLIDIDIIGLDKDKNVVDILKNVPICYDNCSIYKIKNSKYILEINSGLIEKYNIKIGDKAELQTSS